MSEASGVDAKQIGFGLVGLGLGAAIIFIAGLQVGQQFDISALQLDNQAASAPKPKAAKRGDAPPEEPEAAQEAKPSKKAAKGDGDKGGGLSFFRDLEEPDSGPKRLPTPEEGDKEKTPAKASAKSPEAKPAVSSVKLAKSPEAKPSAPPAQLPTRTLKRDGGEGAPAAAAGQQEGDSFSVQIGTFADMEEASALVQELRADKQAAHIVLVDDPENGRRYRVNAGNLKDREAARALLQRLRARGLQATLSE